MRNMPDRTIQSTPTYTCTCAHTHTHTLFTPLQAKKAMESGALVSDEIVVGLINEAMDK